jgi:hypothetical protein
MSRELCKYTENGPHFNKKQAVFGWYGCLFWMQVYGSAKLCIDGVQIK